MKLRARREIPVAQPFRAATPPVTLQRALSFCRSYAFFFFVACVGCSHAREHALLDQFFAASRLRDLTALRNVSNVVFEPREQGTVLSFEIKSVEEVSAGSRIVRVDANVRRPDGQMAHETLLVTISGRMITGVAVVPSTPRS